MRLRRQPVFIHGQTGSFDVAHPEWEASRAAWEADMKIGIIVHVWSRTVGAKLTEVGDLVGKSLQQWLSNTVGQDGLRPSQRLTERW